MIDQANRTVAAVDEMKRRLDDLGDTVGAVLAMHPDDLSQQLVDRYLAMKHATAGFLGAHADLIGSTLAKLEGKP